MKKFAALFESNLYGQILVAKQTSDDDEPMLKITFDPNCDHVETASVNLYYDNEEKQQKAFDGFTLDKLEAFIRPSIALIRSSPAE